MKIIETESDRRTLAKQIDAQALPFTVSIWKGKSKARTDRQNRLQRRWMIEAAEQLDGWTPEEVRGWCKLHCGVPILRDENEEYREKYDRVIKPMPYETKRELMMEPFDFPVTRHMTTKQTNRYFDTIIMELGKMDVELTPPGAPLIENERE